MPTEGMYTFTHRCNTHNWFFGGHIHVTRTTASLRLYRSTNPLDVARFGATDFTNTDEWIYSRVYQSTTYPHKAESDNRWIGWSWFDVAECPSGSSTEATDPYAAWPQDGSQQCPHTPQGHSFQIHIDTTQNDQYWVYQGRPHTSNPDCGGAGGRYHFLPNDNTFYQDSGSESGSAYQQSTIVMSPPSPPSSSLSPNLPSPP